VPQQLIVALLVLQAAIDLLRHDSTNLSCKDDNMTGNI